jgi:hypothetical protein
MELRALYLTLMIEHCCFNRHLFGISHGNWARHGVGQATNDVEDQYLFSNMIAPT